MFAHYNIHIWFTAGSLPSDNARQDEIINRFRQSLGDLCDFPPKGCTFSSDPRPEAINFVVMNNAPDDWIPLTSLTHAVILNPQDRDLDTVWPMDFPRLLFKVTKSKILFYTTIGSRLTDGQNMDFLLERRRSDEYEDAEWALDSTFIDRDGYLALNPDIEEFFGKEVTADRLCQHYSEYGRNEARCYTLKPVRLCSAGATRIIQSTGGPNNNDEYVRDRFLDIPYKGREVFFAESTLRQDNTTLLFWNMKLSLDSEPPPFTALASGDEKLKLDVAYSLVERRLGISVGEYTAKPRPLQFVVSETNPRMAYIVICNRWTVQFPKSQLLERVVSICTTANSWTLDGNPILSILRYEKVKNAATRKETTNTPLENGPSSSNVGGAVKKSPALGRFQSLHQPSMVVVDDFFDNPESVRELALQQTFVEHPTAHKGRRTETRFMFSGLKEEFERLLHIEIDARSWTEPLNGVFQSCIAGDQVVFHADCNDYAAVIYLTPNAPYNSGTSFIASKATGLRAYPTENEAVTLGKSVSQLAHDTFTGKLLDVNAWETVDKIGNVFNRLVLWRSWQTHADTSYFGHSLETGRLFMIFFFNSVKKA